MSAEIPQAVSAISPASLIDALSSSTIPTQYHEREADLVVAQKEIVADGVAALTLTDAKGGELPAWTPGAHIDVVLPDASLTRQYSLSSNPADRHTWRIGILREPKSRGGSQFIHEMLKAGDTVRVRGPRNHFSLVDAPRYLFIAGGIGITPILPMIAAAHARGADWQLLYGGRQRSSMAFLDELAVYGERVRLYPQNEAGMLPLKSFLEPPRNDTLVYGCGPEPLLIAVEGLCASWPVGSLHFERFKAKLPTDAPPTVAETFEVVLQRTGITVTVPPDKSILEVVEAAGLYVLSACREGICGTCEQSVLEGEPDHRDSVLTPAERKTNEVMMICVSRSCTRRLVLDL
jgi:ferredoxin-NADP reductase